MKRYPSPDSCRPWPPPGCCPPWCQRGQGRIAPVPFVPGGTYYAGQVVLYGGEFYVVNVNEPQGIPGDSANFTLIPLTPDEPIESRMGPTGPTGPVGPTGPAGGRTGPTGATEAGSQRHPSTI